MSHLSWDQFMVPCQQTGTHSFSSLAHCVNNTPVKGLGKSPISTQPVPSHDTLTCLTGKHLNYHNTMVSLQIHHCKIEQHETEQSIRMLEFIASLYHQII